MDFSVQDVFGEQFEFPFSSPHSVWRWLTASIYIYIFSPSTLTRQSFTSFCVIIYISFFWISWTVWFDFPVCYLWCIFLWSHTQTHGLRCVYVGLSSLLCSSLHWYIHTQCTRTISQWPWNDLDAVNLPASLPVRIIMCICIWGVDHQTHHIHYINTHTHTTSATASFPTLLSCITWRETPIHPKSKNLRPFSYLFPSSMLHFRIVTVCCVARVIVYCMYVYICSCTHMWIGFHVYHAFVIQHMRSEVWALSTTSPLPGGVRALSTTSSLPPSATHLSLRLHSNFHRPTILLSFPSQLGYEGTCSCTLQ